MSSAEVLRNIFGYILIVPSSHVGSQPEIAISILRSSIPLIAYIVYRIAVYQTYPCDGEKVVKRTHWEHVRIEPSTISVRLVADGRLNVIWRVVRSFGEHF